MIKENLKILIVDDDFGIREILRGFLADKKAEIKEVHDGTTAALTYQQFMPDIVFMDLSMPERDGYDAIKDIKCVDPEAKIIVLTSLSLQIFIEDVGIADFISKPFTKEQILVAIDKHTSCAY